MKWEGLEKKILIIYSKLTIKINDDNVGELVLMLVFPRHILLD